MLRRARWTLVLALLTAIGARAAGQAAAVPPQRLYENSIRQIGAILASGAEARLVAAVKVESSGGAEAAIDSAERDEIGRLRSVLDQAFLGDSRFHLIFLGRAAEISAGTGDAAEEWLLSRAHDRGGNLCLLVHVDKYATGSGAMSETTARLIDLASRRQLASDTVWSVTSVEGRLSVFVNGERVR